MRIPTIKVKIPAISSTSQNERWIPGNSGLIPTEPKWNVTWSNWSEANQAAT